MPYSSITLTAFTDTANAIATVVSTRVLSPRNAIIMAACLNFLGALFSTHVAATVASGLVDTARFQSTDLPGRQRSPLN